VKTADFDYYLPPELIAQTPAARRADSRLLVVDRATRKLVHRTFRELPSLLRAGDLLIRNTARVLPARLFGERSSGGRVECLLLRPEGEGHAEAGFDEAGSGSPTPATGRPSKASGGENWWCLLRPGRKLPPGTMFVRPGEFTAHVLEKSDSGEYLVSVRSARAGETVTALADRIGAMPLPPYIRREVGGPKPVAAIDRERYQTVFADPAQQVAVAAPTAGLHFTNELLSEIRQRGVACADVILHVGLGTFRPIESEDVSDHLIHRERIEIPAATRAVIDEPVAGRRIAVGTTSVRTVEHYARSPRRAVDRGDPFTDEADLFLHPPSDFAVVNALITNFHLPRSTLLCLLAAFLTPGSTDGVEWFKVIYAEAARERYRFLSYGDAMLIL